MKRILCIVALVLTSFSVATIDVLGQDVNSMTKEERNKPKILDASRRKRIARGSGVEVRDVNEVIQQYRQMQKMMEQLRKGKFNIPGMGNLGF